MHDPEKEQLIKDAAGYIDFEAGVKAKNEPESDPELSFDAEKEGIVNEKI